MEFFKNENRKFKEEIFTLQNTLKQTQDSYNQLKEDYLNYQEDSKINASILQEEYSKLQEEFNQLKNQQQQQSPSLQSQPQHDISPQTHQILTNKTHNQYTWYLLKPKDSPESYSSYIWIPHSQIETTLTQYNKFITENENINNIMQVHLQNIEKREELISKLKFKLQKLQEQSGLSLSTTGIANQKASKSRQSDNGMAISKEVIDLAILNKTNPVTLNTNRKNVSIESTSLMVKYNNALLKIDELEEQIGKYQKALIKTQRSGRESIRTVTEGSNNDSSRGMSINESKFMESLIRLQEENNDKEKILEVVKQNFREVQMKLKNVNEEIKVIIANIKITNNIKDNVKKIFKLMNYSDDDIAKIIKDGNEKKKILGVV